MSANDSSPGEAPQPAARTITVLLVDDQHIIGEAVRRLFHDQPDMAFHHCADPANALSRANELKPDVILQDLVMPGIDGIELVRLYRENSATTTTPIIILSGSEDAETKSKALAAGANDFMVKLPQQNELLKRIRSYPQREP
jgi:PleD family two-component response regulator